MAVSQSYAQWETDVRLITSPGTSFSSSMAVSGSSIHLVWRDDRDGNQEIYYIRSTDGGLTWGADTRLTDSTSFALNPSFAVGVGDNDLGITKDQVNTFNLIGKLLPLALLCPVNSEN